MFQSPSTNQAFYLTLISASNPLTYEIVLVTARSVDTLTVVRAQQGTTATTFAAADLAQQLITAGDLRSFQQTLASSTPILWQSGTATLPASGNVTSNVSVTLVTPFPTATLWVGATPVGQCNNVYGGNAIMTAYNLATTGFNLEGDTNTGGQASAPQKIVFNQTVSVNWIAVGN